MDEYETHVEVFECDEPASGAWYQVLEDEWLFNDLTPLRIIKRISLESVAVGR